MADLKISQLNSGNPAQTNDEIPIARSGANFKITAGSISALPPTTAAATEVIYVNAAGTSLDGDSGMTYDATTGQLSLTGKTVTTNSPVLNLAQTWNNAGVNFTSARLNVTNTASGASSNLLDLQVAGSSVFSVTPSTTNPGLTVTNSSAATLFSVSNTTIVGTRTVQLTPSANTSALTVGSFSLSGSNAQSMLDLAGTWNTTGTPTALKLNVTDTASNAASLLMDIQTGGTSRFAIRKDGNVGIGTSSPVYRLDVAESGAPTSTNTFTVARISGSDSVANDLTLLGPNTSQVRIKFGDPEDAAIGEVGYNHSTNAMRFNTDGAERMRIDSSGNVGIGTTSPSGKLDVVGTGAVISRIGGDSTGTTSLYFGNTTGGVISVRSSAYLAFETNATERMRLDSSGNLGLGVTPSAWRSTDVALQVRRASLWDDNNNAMYLGHNVFENSSGNYVYIGTDFATNYRQTDGTHAWLTAPSGTAGNTITFTQAMTLDANSNLQLGTTTNLGSGSRLSVAVDGTYGSVAFARNTDNTFAVATDYYKSRGSAGSPTAVQSGDGIFRLRSVPYQGSAYAYLTSMNIEVDGTFTSGQNPPTRIVWYTNVANGSATERMRITGAGNVVAGGSAALATTATDGFLYVPTCAGAPTGIPTAITGMAPIIVDTTNNKLYFYSGGAWRDAGP